MTRRLFPSSFVTGLQPKDGNAYRVFLQPSEEHDSKMATLRHIDKLWQLRDEEGRWVGFTHLDRVLARSPQPVP